MIILPSIYTLIMTIGLLVSRHWLHISYGEKGFIIAMLPFLVILALFACLSYYKHRQVIQPLPPKNHLFLIAFIPTVLVALFAFVRTLSLSSAFFLTFIGAILVGIAEEGMYRGFAFTHAAKNWGVIKGILFSAFAFSLLHVVNIFGGLSFSSMLLQLVNTFLMGIFFACCYYFTQNIVMLMIFHGLWDYIVLSPIATDYPFVLILTLLVFILTIFMFTKIYKQRHTI